MPGPLDIYQQNYSENFWSDNRMRPSLLPDLSGVFGHPAVMLGTLAADFGLSRYMTSHKRMVGSMDREQHRLFRSDIRSKYGRGGIASHRRYVIGATDKTTRGFARNVISGPGFTMSDRPTTLAGSYGRKAAGRMGAARVVTGLARFANIFWMVELGATLGGILGDAILNYEPQKYTNPRRSLESGGAFVETRHAQTQRMRAIQAIHNTQLSTRAALGQEASFSHYER